MGKRVVDCVCVCVGGSPGERQGNGSRDRAKHWELSLLVRPHSWLILLISFTGASPVSG